MKRKVLIRRIGYILICLAVGFLAYVRLAPIQTERWNVPILVEANNDLQGGAVRIVANTPGAMATLANTLNGMARTSLLAGSVADGRVTYITRSKWIGFPDYTTLERSGDSIKMFARLRFGSEDFGVNAARLQKLMLALD